ncbi:MAG: MraY family glycosyltransferase [Pseudomonadota bacterium]
MLTLTLSLLLTFVASWFLVGRFRAYALTKGLLDNPNARSSHTLATPRGGGLVFMLLWPVAGISAILLGVWSLQQALVFLPGAALIGLIGYWDDHHDLPARWRALVHFLAAAGGVAVLGGTDTLDLGMTELHLGWVASVLAVLTIVWSVNLFNFMDGTDGIAGVEAFFVFSVGGLLLWQAGGAALAAPIWALAAAVAGFLVWNWPRAKIFMGDVGSGFLGFLIAVFALAGEAWFGVPALLWVILYGVFWFDATITLLRRIAAGERWYAAHRSHAYQRLHHGGGWSHGRILWGVIALNTVLASLALWANAHREMLPWAVLTTFAVLAAAYAMVERIAPMYPARRSA